TRHKTPLTQRGSWARLAGDHFRTASQRLENGFVEPPQWVVRAVAHNRERSSAFLAANSSDERMPLLCNSASRSIFAKRSVSWALSGRYGSLAGATRGSEALVCTR